MLTPHCTCTDLIIAPALTSSLHLHWPHHCTCTDLIIAPALTSSLHLHWPHYCNCNYLIIATAITYCTCTDLINAPAMTSLLHLHWPHHCSCFKVNHQSPSVDNFVSKITSTDSLYEREIITPGAWPTSNLSEFGGKTANYRKVKCCLMLIKWHHCHEMMSGWWGSYPPAHAHAPIALHPRCWKMLHSALKLHFMAITRSVKPKVLSYNLVLAPKAIPPNIGLTF